MPDRIIDIPRVGQVAFPETMTDDEIAVAADELYQQAPPGRDEPWAYLGATLKNLPGSVMREGTKMVQGAASLASDLVTLNPMVPSTIQPEGAREAAKDRLASVAQNFIPGIIQTYGAYLDPKYRETTVRDEPAKVIGDMAGLVGGVKTLTSQPVRRAAAAATRRVLENPVAGAVVGGMAGSPLGPAGIAIGAAEGATRGPAVFRRLRRMLEPVRSSAPDGRLVRSTVDDAVRSSVDDLAKEGGQFYTYADDVQDIQGAGGEYTLSPFVRGAQPENIAIPPRGGRLTTPPAPAGEDFAALLAQEMNAPESAALPLSHPTGGGYTLPPPPNPAAGGRLRPGSAPTGSIESQLVDALRGLPGRTTADPGVVLSPRAQAVANAPETALQGRLRRPDAPTSAPNLGDELVAALRELPRQQQRVDPGIRLSPRAQAAAAGIDDAALAAEDTARRMTQAQRTPNRLTDMAADEASTFQARQAHGVAGFRNLPQGMPSSPIPSIPREGAASLKDFVEFWAKQLRQRKPSITDQELQQALEAMMKRSSRQ